MHGSLPWYFPLNFPLAGPCRQGFGCWAERSCAGGAGGSVQPCQPQGIYFPANPLLSSSPRAGGAPALRGYLFRYYSQYLNLSNWSPTGSTQLLCPISHLPLLLHLCKCSLHWFARNISTLFYQFGFLSQKFGNVCSELSIKLLLIDHTDAPNTACTRRWLGLGWFIWLNKSFTSSFKDQAALKIMLADNCCVIVSELGHKII